MKVTLQRCFIYNKEAWYYQKGTPEEVAFGIYSPTGGCLGEMYITWETLAGELTAILGVWHDCWHLLTAFQDLFARITFDGNPTPQDVMGALLQSNFVDITKRTPPGDAESRERQAKIAELERELRKLKKGE